MFSVDAWKFKAVDARSLVPVVVAIPVVDTGSIKQAKQAAALGGPGGKNSGLGGVRCEAMEEDYRSVGLEEILANCPAPQKGKQYSANTVYSAGGELLTLTGDFVGRWNGILRGSPQSSPTCLPMRKWRLGTLRWTRPSPKPNSLR
ncbi:hypothetical protein L3Q82_010176 [Scortum barcoo]|uniref:Uncharacterized protein n=1 Tax=Scortum barcoo TaxID=214431 RepID=A0ACB8WBB5_9TELE|nr:hypothetical protein L3Q82_010176 [Scortum barcoo]